MPNADRVTVENEDSPSSWLAENAVVLIIVAGLIGLLTYKGIDFTIALVVLIGLGLVIFVHELGHFLAAKSCDVYVETFSIGFGPALPFCKYKWGETTYKIGIIPLGGYVKMLGEGSESEEGEDDPRSYKNKTVPQRMLIISAGVIMNMIFAVIVFVGVYMGPGDDRGSGVIGVIDPGSPAWEAGLRSGVVLKRVGGIDNPFFDQIKPTIALSGSNERVPIVYAMPDTKTFEIELLPRYEAENAGQKLIGILPASNTMVRGAPKLEIPPVVPGSPAAAAKPAIEHRDRIIGCTDSNNKLTELPADPRNSGHDRRDFFEFYKRLVDRAGEPITVQVEREGSSKPVDIDVPAAFYRDLGLVMRMDTVLSIRHKSPAQKAGVKAREEGGDAGDEIERVEVTDPSGKIIRFTNTPSANPQSNIEERPLDPMRLPFELERWAAKAAAPKTVKLGVLRTAGHADREKVELALEWDDQWKYSREAALSVRSPVSIPGLGLAYRIKTEVVSVKKDSVAHAAGIQSRDVVKSLKLYRDDKLKKSLDLPLRPDEWAFAFTLYNEQMNVARIDLTVTRDGKTIDVSITDPTADTTWPMIERGFSFDTDTTHQEATSVTEALSMGSSRVTDTAKNVYLSLRSMVTGGISFLKNANGPLEIARAGYYVASESTVKFLLLLAILSVNLAVLNFLPIPVLDGGHMVFLTYEGLRGRPAPEVIRTAATFAGMALLLSLMACVLFLDFWKLIFKS